VAGARAKAQQQIEQAPRRYRKRKRPKRKQDSPPEAGKLATEMISHGTKVRQRQVDDEPHALAAGQQALLLIGAATFTPRLHACE